MLRPFPESPYAKEHSTEAPKNPAKIGALEKSAVRIMPKLYEATGGHTRSRMPTRLAVARRAAIRSGQLKRSLVGLCESRWSPKRINKCSLRPDKRRSLRAMATDLAALD